MKNAGRKFKKFIITIVIIGVAVVASIAYFFISNDAPLLFGKVIFKLEYKEGLTLDIYLPTNDVFEKSPVVVFFHGGAWITGGKEVINANRFNGAVNSLREKGYTFVCPDYTLAEYNKSPFPDCIIDAFDALDWIANHEKQYNFDLQNIGVFGESAGGHIALMTAYTNDSEFLPDVNIKNIKINYVVDVYGPTEMGKLYQMETLNKINQRLERLPENLRKHFDIAQFLLGFDPDQDTAKVRDFIETYSPINYIKQDSPPTLIIHGDNDQIVPIDQSIVLKQKLDSLNVEYEFHMLENVNHGFLRASNEQKKEVQRWIADFVESNYHIY